MNKHWYGVTPNGTYPGEENQYRLDWYTELDDGRCCYVPACADYSRKIFPRLNAPKEELIEDAKALSRGRYDIVVYAPSSDAPGRYVIEQTIKADPEKTSA